MRRRRRTAGQILNEYALVVSLIALTAIPIIGHLSRHTMDWIMTAIDYTSSSAVLPGQSIGDPVDTPPEYPSRYGGEPQWPGT